MRTCGHPRSRDGCPRCGRTLPESESVGSPGGTRVIGRWIPPISGGRVGRGIGTHRLGRAERAWSDRPEHTGRGGVESVGIDAAAPSVRIRSGPAPHRRTRWRRSPDVPGSRPAMRCNRGSPPEGEWDHLAESACANGTRLMPSLRVTACPVARGSRLPAEAVRPQRTNRVSLIGCDRGPDHPAGGRGGSRTSGPFPLSASPLAPPGRFSIGHRPAYSSPSARSTTASSFDGENGFVR
jgi:hypothetical protein